MTEREERILGNMGNLPDVFETLENGQIVFKKEFKEIADHFGEEEDTDFPVIGEIYDIFMDIKNGKFADLKDYHKHLLRRIGELSNQKEDNCKCEVHFDYDADDNEYEHHDDCEICRELSELERLEHNFSLNRVTNPST